MKWFKVKDKLPDYDEFVLWFTVDGNILWDCIDKDANIEEFINCGEPSKRYTHWCRINLPNTKSIRKI